MVIHNIRCLWIDSRWTLMLTLSHQGLLFLLFCFTGWSPCLSCCFEHMQRKSDRPFIKWYYREGDICGCAFGLNMVHTKQHIVFCYSCLDEQYNSSIYVLAETLFIENKLLGIDRLIVILVLDLQQNCRHVKCFMSKPCRNPVVTT